MNAAPNLSGLTPDERRGVIWERAEQVRAMRAADEARRLEAGESLDTLDEERKRRRQEVRARMQRNDQFYRGLRVEANAARIAAGMSPEAVAAERAERLQEVRQRSMVGGRGRRTTRRQRRRAAVTRRAGRR